MSRQEALLTTYVEEYEDKDGLGYSLSTDHMVFLKAEGVSGFSGKNIEPKSVLHNFITDCISGKIKNAVLIVENIDRFSRTNPNVAAGLFLALINNKCNVHEIDTETVHHEYSDLNQISAGLIRSHKESLRKQKLSIKNWDERFKQTVKKQVPLTGRCPGWLKVVDGIYHEIPERTAPIRLIFELYNNGFGQAYIRDKLNNEGYHYNDKTWSNWSVHRVLKDERVTGKHRTQSPLRDNYDKMAMYPVIISDEQYKLAEQRLIKPGRDKKINRRANTVFAGVLICGICKSAHIIINNDKGKRFGRCSYSIAGNKRCSARGFKYNIVEETLLKHLQHLNFESLRQVDHSYELERLENELIYNKNYLDIVQKKIDIDDIPSIVDYKLYKKLEVAIRNIEGEITNIKALDNVNGVYENIAKSINYDLLDVRNVSLRQEFNIKIRKVIKEIQIFKIGESVVLVSVLFYASNDVQWLTINLKNGDLLGNTYIENGNVFVSIDDKTLMFDSGKKQYFFDEKPISDDEAYSLLD